MYVKIVSNATIVLESKSDIDSLIYYLDVAIGVMYGLSECAEARNALKELQEKLSQN